MGRSARIREQLISSFRAELAEHIQTMTDGLLAFEEGRVPPEERQAHLETIFRAAHSLKGAARAVNVTIIEQLAHSLENLLDAIQYDTVPLTSQLFTACYRALDAIQSVQAAYETGETTPPLEAIIALADLEAFRKMPHTQPASAAEAAAHAPQVEAGAQPAATGQQGADRPRRTLEAILADGMAQASDMGPSSAERPVGGEETVRVSVAKLDSLMVQLSELLVARMRAQQRLEQSRALQEYLSAWQREWLPARAAGSRLGQRQEERGRENGIGTATQELATILAYVDANQQYLVDATTLADRLSRLYTEDTLHLSLAIDQIEQEIKHMRMLPLATITVPFGRMVRDLAQAAGKEVRLEISGDNTEIDKQILEQIKDPLVHLLRNAIDHGIEQPSVRQAAGKPRTGKIILAAEQQGQDVVVRVSDDGAGLDLDALRRALARRGRADVASLTEGDLHDLIFASGVSTCPLITDISGRGIGLAVVRRNVEALHGRVEVDSAPGAGSTFILRLPLTLTSLHGLLVRCAGQMFALPLSAVHHIRMVRAGEVQRVEGREVIEYSGLPVVLARLDDMLELRRGSNVGQAACTVVIVSAGERLAGLAVDELVGEEEVVVKSLGRQLKRVTGIAGATVSGSGEIVLILNPVDLVNLAIRGQRRSVFETHAPNAEQEEPTRHRILIVDDSITTRTLEKNILEAAGYVVEVATDGIEALSLMATQGTPDLVVTDILMPRMDGFELVERIKAEERTAHLPVILVSSLDSPEDKARGIQVGADAYIVKSRFDQSNLLDTIEQLI
ncbi:MAG: response regulator [Anaerolineae bacterium]|nr:response regulator [Anaerolineae bacterium]